jgi:hypothetical protein
MTNMGWDNVLGGMRALAIAAEKHLTADEFHMIWRLIDAGEPGVAFEALCVQLDEHDAAVSQTMLDEARVLGTAMNRDPELWQGLRVAEG